MVCRKLEVFKCHIFFSGSELCCEMCTQLIRVNQSEPLVSERPAGWHSRHCFNTAGV